jgi:hypothetical protein
MSCNCNSNKSGRRAKIEKAIRSGVRNALNEKESSKDGLKGIVREAVREVLTEEDDYQEFVQGVMQTLGIDSPQDLTEEGRERFFNLLGNNYSEDTDEADDVPMEELKNTFEPKHFKGEAPDFLKKQDEEVVRESVRNALQNLLR